MTQPSRHAPQPRRAGLQGRWPDVDRPFTSHRWGHIDKHPWPLDFVVHLCGLMRLDEKQTSETLHDYVATHGMPDA